MARPRRPWRRAWFAALPLLLALPSGCVTGVLFTNITLPLDQDLDGTPLRFARGREDSKVLDINPVRIEWGTSGIVDAARRAGLVEIEYADLETLSVLGVWTQRWALVYGRRADEIVADAAGADAPVAGP